MTLWSAVATVEVFFYSDEAKPDELVKEATAILKEKGCVVLAETFVMPATQTGPIRNSA